MKALFFGVASLALWACTPQSPWRLLLKHDRDGNVLAGDVKAVMSAVRQGCALRVAWGARRNGDPGRTIEHIATPVWVSIRNSDSVEVQLDDFLINLAVLGEPNEDHPARARFGGTDKAVMWRANFKTDGTFDAVWYDPVTGALITRVPQRHGGSWFADCAPGDAPPLYPNQ